MPKPRLVLPNEVREEIENWLVEIGISPDQKSARRSLEPERIEHFLAELFWRNSDPIDVLSLLRSYCENVPRKRERNSSGEVQASEKGPNKEQDSDDRDRRPEGEKQLLKLSRRLAEDAKRVREISGLLVPYPARMVEQMEKHSLALKHAYDFLMDEELRRGEHVGFLVAAVQIVKILTGRPHYPEITALIGLLGCKHVEESTTRINVKNYEKRGETSIVPLHDIRLQIQQGNKKWAKLRRTLQQTNRG